MLLLIHAVVIRGLKIVLIGHNKRHYDIDKNPRESRSEEREQHKKQPDYSHIHVEILGKTRADAADLLFACFFIKFLFRRHNNRPFQNELLRYPQKR